MFHATDVEGGSPANKAAVARPVSNLHHKRLGAIVARVAPTGTRVA
ncbi:hypothetical protein GEU84_019695 [Fertoebacter nigrum]|uniref:Uncharacterized protein n=1 Tax=Fertoeibacter niger TaxID=2656921 RepID=A0A8X8H2X8_9RHOB|nr:hypothetical protein [Fertoeibacter niger]NUB46618.1 hypothetical protein [Fertoeibacter niger]